MAWISSTLAFVLNTEDAPEGAGPEALEGAFTKDAPFVHALSRNGTLLHTLKAIAEQWSPGSELYLLRDFARLDVNDIHAGVHAIDSLIDSIDRHPELVLEATKAPYTPTITLLSKEFEPQPAVMVYPSGSVVKDGYVHAYTEAQVRELMSAATASEDPCPPYDDDGESLEYVFCFLKSHLRLLHLASATQRVVVYGELNRYAGGQEEGEPSATKR